ncbi:MAG: FecR domain-containing protein, partial [Pontixanthobacter sp.]
MRGLPVKILSPAILLLCSTSAYAQTAPWTVSEASGQVVVRDAAGERSARRGVQIAPGGMIQAGRNGSAVIVRNKEFVTIRPNTRIRIASEEKSRSVIQVLQDWGSAVFNVGKQKDPHFGVETPYLAAVVKGTTFSVTVAAEGASMQVIEGAVEVATSDGEARDLVSPGEVAMIAADDRFRLTVEGGDTRIVDSPNRTTANEVTVPTPTASAVTITGEAAVASYNQGTQATFITTAIGSSATDLGEVSGG